MDHSTNKKTQPLKRLGFHYFQDEEKYSLDDASLWSQRLKALHADWLVLKNPRGRAIPEDFIRALAKQNIKIIIDFNIKIGDFENLSEIEILLEVYGKWGVRYACLFNHPNIKKSWGATKWIENDIVATHAEYFINFADTCVKNHIQPIFSPLFPGGDYPDTAFLERSLQIISQKSSELILDHLVLSCFGWLADQYPEKNKVIKSKLTDPHFFQSNFSRNHLRGFRLFERYSAISVKVLGCKKPVILFQTGCIRESRAEPRSGGTDWQRSIQTIIKLSAGENVFENEESSRLIAPIGSEVIAVCIYLLSAEEKSTTSAYRWFTQDGNALPISKFFLSQEYAENFKNPKTKNKSTDRTNFKYQRYVFIDPSLNSKMQGLLEQLTPYIKRHKPMIGFSMLEGANAAYLIVITENKTKFLEANSHLLPEGNIYKIISTANLHEIISE